MDCICGTLAIKLIIIMTSFDVFLFNDRTIKLTVGGTHTFRVQLIYVWEGCVRVIIFLYTLICESMGGRG